MSQRRDPESCQRAGARGTPGWRGSGVCTYDLRAKVNSARVKFSLMARLLVLLLAVVFCLAFLETAVRLMSSRDADGNAWVRSTHLKPYRVPVEAVKTVLESYAASGASALMYDADLGWTQRPGVSHHNALGFITTSEEVAKAPTAGRLRIALFGGSFTQGNFESGWWRVLETKLRAEGLDVEVLNFGVAGFGMDQAWLRWRLVGAEYHPDIVVFGFCAANARDNVNLFRALQNADSGIPFSKPRFVLNGGRLTLINSPTPLPAALPGILAHLPQWPLIGHEFFFRPGDFRMTALRRSRLFSLAEAKLENVRERGGDAEIYAPEGEPMQLARAIVNEFGREVEGSGSQFCLVNLPSASDLSAFQTTGRFPFDGLYRELQRDHWVVSTEQKLLQIAGQRPVRDFFRDGHFLPEFNEAIGDTLAQEIRRKVKR